MCENEKTTAKMSPVGAGNGQSLKSSNNSIAENQADGNWSLDELFGYFQESARNNDPNHLKTMSLNQLYDSVYQGRMAVVEDLLYTGAYILAGAPKIGKSFLVAQIAYHVSTGQMLWEYRVRQGTVLYLALEDDYRRLQMRMSRMFGVDGTDNLYFAIQAKQVGQGLDEQLEGFLKAHPDTRLVIVDTLQKVREVSGDAYSYAGDYDIIGRLKQLAEQHQICVLIVHHTRKQPSGDSFEMISGTTGLLGCADGALLMMKQKRTDQQATLDVVGRDQADQKLYLERDLRYLVWTLEHVENELWKEPPDPVLLAVFRHVNEVQPAKRGGR